MSFSIFVTMCRLGCLCVCLLSHSYDALRKMQFDTNDYWAGSSRLSGGQEANGIKKKQQKQDNMHDHG